MYAVGEFEGQTVSYQIEGKHEMHDTRGNYQVETWIFVFQMHNVLRIAYLYNTCKKLSKLMRQSSIRTLVLKNPRKGFT